MEKIVKETMHSYNGYLKNLPKGCLQIATNLRNEVEKEGLKDILDFSDGVSWLIEVNKLMEINGFENEFDFNVINNYLEEINNGLLIEDYYMVADLFEYEIKPFFENCKPYKIPEEN